MQTLNLIKLVLIYLIFFLIGAIPFGMILARLKKKDLREIGSGNIGATNVYRVLGWRYAALAFGLDGLKGAAPVLIFEWLFGKGILTGVAAVVAVLGHIFSPYLKFKGGKGVATGFGAMVAISPIPALLCLGIWILILAVSRIAGLASIIAAISLPILILGLKQDRWILYTSLAIVIAVILSHYSNIARLLQGKEKPIQKIG